MERFGECGMLVNGVLETRGEVDLGGLDGREAVEQLVGEGRRPMLDRTGEPVFARDDPELPQDLEIELDLRNATIGERDATVRGAGLDAHLRDARRTGSPRLEFAAITIEVGTQLLDRRILCSDLANLTADADRDPIGLERPDVGRQFGGPTVVLA